MNDSQNPLAKIVNLLSECVETLSKDSHSPGIQHQIEERLKAVRDEVQLLIAELNEADWVAMRRAVRIELGRFRTKPISKDATIVWQAVRELGGDPSEYTAAEWERVRELCSKKGKEYQSWRGPKIMYRRTRETLEMRSRVEP